MGIILDTLICFAKICDEKKEPAFFKGNNTSLIYNFFYKMSLKYPDDLKDLNFIKGDSHYISNKIEQEWNNLNLRQVVQPWGRNYHPFEASKKISGLYDTLENKETFKKIAQDFYNELGCDNEGKMRKEVDYNTIDFSLI
jgi:hypothetical protein